MICGVPVGAVITGLLFGISAIAIGWAWLNGMDKR